MSTSFRPLPSPAADAPSPGRPAGPDAALQRPIGSVSLRRVVAAGTLLLLALVATVLAAAWRTGLVGSGGHSPRAASTGSTAELWPDCGWVPNDDCVQASPDICRCRAVWRAGDGAQGYGPCGQFGERDPCVLTGIPSGGDDAAGVVDAGGLQAPAPAPAAPKSGKWASVHSSFRDGFFVPIQRDDVERARPDFEEALAQPAPEAQTSIAPTGLTATTPSAPATSLPPPPPPASLAPPPLQAPQAGPPPPPLQASPLPATSPPTLPPSAPERLLPVPPTETPPASGRRGSFLVLGDWGWDEAVHGNLDSSSCQKAIANAMLEKFQELGDVKFIINVGDSFYPSGVESRSDDKWDRHWRNRYAPELRSVPWYTTYGNHDYQHDPCACGNTPQECAQFNDDISDTNWFYFPDFSWYKEHPELGVEVISLDTNRYMEAWNREFPADELVPADCQYSSCAGDCTTNIIHRTDQAVELFKQRVQASSAKNMLVFSHYPTDYLWPSDDLMNGLKSTQGADGSPRHIEYFGGHRHSVDQDTTTPITPNNNWLVGGGGGWGTDSDKQGFVVGEIAWDFSIKTYSVLASVPCGA